MSLCPKVVYLGVDFDIFKIYIKKKVYFKTTVWYYCQKFKFFFLKLKRNVNYFAKAHEQESIRIKFFKFNFKWKINFKLIFFISIKNFKFLRKSDRFFVKFILTFERFYTNIASKNGTHSLPFKQISECATGV